MHPPTLWKPWVSALLGLLLVAAMPFIVSNNYYLGVLTFVAINTMLAVGLNLLMGYAGQISLGHAAFFGLGAYASAILTTHYHLSTWLAMCCGMIITCTIAVMVGIPCLRLKGHYLAMATLGFGWIIYILLMHWTSLTGGTSGIEMIPSLAIGKFAFISDVSRFYLTGVVAILLLVISANIVNSRIGRALRAVHVSEPAAASLGIDISRAKVQIFVLSAAYASLAGSCYAHVVNFISPATFSFSFSVELVVMVVIGGMASVWGAPLGAAAITLLVEWLRSLGESMAIFREFDVIAHGAILILVMVFLPEGLTCGIRDLVATGHIHHPPPESLTPEQVDF